MTTNPKKPLLGTRSVADKLNSLEKEELAPAPINHEEVEVEVVTKNELSLLDEKYAMKKFNLVKPKKGSRVDIDADLHSEFKIAAIRRGVTQKDWLEEIIREAVLKANKRFEK